MDRKVTVGCLASDRFVFRFFACVMTGTRDRVSQVKIWGKRLSFTGYSLARNNVYVFACFPPINSGDGWDMTFSGLSRKYTSLILSLYANDLDQFSEHVVDCLAGGLRWGSIFGWMVFQFDFSTIFSLFYWFFAPIKSDLTLFFEFWLFIHIIFGNQFLTFLKFLPIFSRLVF